MAGASLVLLLLGPLVGAVSPVSTEPLSSDPWALPDDPRDALLLAAGRAGLDPLEVRRLAVVDRPSADPHAAYAALRDAVDLGDAGGLPLPAGHVADALVPLIDAVRHAVVLREEAMAGLGEADRTMLMMLDGAWRDSRRLDDRAVLEDVWQRSAGLPVTLDRTRIAAAAYLLLDAALEAAPSLSTVVDDWSTDTADASCLFDADGLLLVCGTGDDTATGDYLLSVDLGGNDVYDTNAGSSGIGVMWGGTNGLPAALALDLSGDDTYRGGSQVQGTGTSTPGVLVDLLGDDTYLSSSLGFNFVQGAGNLGGVGVLHDALGSDVYRTPAGRACDGCETAWDSQGIGILGGIGLLHDAAGDDVMVGGTMAQGVGDFDAVGFLIDLGGWDYLEAVRQSQGFGDGLGFGALFSGSGSDSWYMHENHGQGAGLSGVGVALSVDGDDAYAAASSSRGYGVEYKVYKPLNDLLTLVGIRAPGVGIFIDLAGADRYGGAGCDGCMWGDGGLGLDAI